MRKSAKTDILEQLQLAGIASILPSLRGFSMAAPLFLECVEPEFFGPVGLRHTG